MTNRPDEGSFSFTALAGRGRGAMVAQWVVLLEVANEPVAPALDAGALYDALNALAETQISLLRSDGRCAVQMEIGAAGPAEALFSALARWREAVRALAASSWDVVRVELLTPEELEPQRDGAR